MKCPYCNSDNREGAVYCEKCEMPLNMMTKKRTVRKQAPVQPEAVEPLFYEVCPNCGAALSDCTPIVKTTVTSSGGGYGLFSGCCGTILLGPLGLLCGLRKRTITSSSQTWWACRKCGKEFIEKEAATSYIDTAITGAATVTFMIAVIWQVIFAVIGFNRWVRDIALLTIAGVWIVLPEGIKEATGHTIKQLLTVEKRTSFYTRCVLFAFGSFLLGAVIGSKVMEYLLG